MKHKVTIEFDDAEGAKEAPPKETKAQAQDVWRFGEIREKLWGKGSPNDVFGLAGIRKTLWGK